MYCGAVFYLQGFTDTVGDIIGLDPSAHGTQERKLLIAVCGAASAAASEIEAPNLSQ